VMKAAVSKQLDKRALFKHVGYERTRASSRSISRRRRGGSSRAACAGGRPGRRDGDARGGDGACRALDQLPEVRLAAPHRPELAGGPDRKLVRALQIDALEPRALGVERGDCFE